MNALTQANAQGPSTDARVREKAERLILPFLNKIPVKAGEVYEIRPGTIHALGRGVRLFEIQQASDLTYRVWDWNRPDAKKLKEGKLEFRPLHLEKARRVLNFKGAPPASFRLKPVAAGGEEILVVDREKKFAAHRISLGNKNKSHSIKTAGSFQVVTAVRGEVRVGPLALRQGCSALIPACAGEIVLEADAPAEIIRSYVPA